MHNLIKTNFILPFSICSAQILNRPPYVTVVNLLVDHMPKTDEWTCMCYFVKSYLFKISLLIYDLQSKDWLNTYYAEWLSEGTQATQSVKWNDMYKWKDDIKYLGYELELVCAQGYCWSHHKWPRNCYQHLDGLEEGCIQLCTCQSESWGPLGILRVCLTIQRNNNCNSFWHSDIANGRNIDFWEACPLKDSLW